MERVRKFFGEVEKLENSDALYYELEPVLGSDVALESTGDDWNKITDKIKEIACEIITNDKVDVYKLIQFIKESQEKPF